MFLRILQGRGGSNSIGGQVGIGISWKIDSEYVADIVFSGQGMWWSSVVCSDIDIVDGFPKVDIQLPR